MEIDNQYPMKTFVTLTLILLMNNSIGQILFNNTYHKLDWDYADAVLERQDGKYLVAGSSRSNLLTDYDVNILLIDSAGNTIWDKYLGIPDTLEFAYSLIATSDNNYLISGRIGNYYPYMMKFDSSGTIVWEKRYDSNGFCTGGYSIGETADSNYFFVRPDYSFYSTTLFKTTMQGDTIWTKSYDSLTCFSAIITNDNGFALIGNYNFMTIQDIKLVKTDSNGDTMWTKLYGGIGYDDATSIQQLPDNGYIIAGSYDGLVIDDENDTYIIRTNPNGDTLWTKRYYHMGVPVHIKECAYSSGYILSTTRYVQNAFPNPDEQYISILKLDTLGNLQWSRHFDGGIYAIGNNVTQTSDGGFLLSGSINNSLNLADMILIKLDSIGNFVLSINDNQNQNSTIAFAFPNPAVDNINFQLISGIGIQIKQLKILNIMGQEMKIVNDINTVKIQINLDLFSTGFYIYQLTATDNSVLTGKFIVKK